MSNNALAIGTNVRLKSQIGEWPAGARARVIPNPIRIMPYDKVNSTGERKEFVTEPSVWIIMVNEFGLRAIPKFAVTLDEIEVQTK